MRYTTSSERQQQTLPLNSPMPIPHEFIDRVLASTDIVELIRSRVELRKAGRDYAGLCPFHTEKTPSFTVSPAKRFYYCFGCRASGTAFDFLMQTQGMDFPAAVEELATRVGLEMPETSGSSRLPNRIHDSLYVLLEEAVEYYHKQLCRGKGVGHERVRSYLKTRGISSELAAKYQLGYAPSGNHSILKHFGSGKTQALIQAGLIVDRSGVYKDMFRDRLMFPIREWRRGHNVGFGARVLGIGNPKYLNTPETPIFQKGREIYGLHRVLNCGVSYDHVYIVEGYMDVIGLATNDVNNAVATLGTAIRSEQLQQLFRRFKRLVICLDGDTAGRKAAVAAMQVAMPLLYPGRELEFMLLPEDVDPDSFVRAQGRADFEDPAWRVSLPEFLLDWAMEGLDMTSLEGRNTLCYRAGNWLHKLGDRMLRELILNTLAERVGITVERLEAQINAPVTPPLRITPTKQHKHLPSPKLLGIAISLLLNEPATADDELDLTNLNIKGIDVLQKIVALVRSRPGISCAGILEHFRGSIWEPRLRELAAERPPLGDGADLKQEFHDAVKRLHEQHLRHRSRTLKMIERPSEAQQEELRMLETQLARTTDKHVPL